ncbi:DUF2497 domain-containing protein [Acuticoccus sediminis]|uniref:DUF2497 domain-containing protein n=1 Tax=Acuticoccus sediminis TaxID=2184697 RepID=UPI001CFC839F|nr:DUF2497 domain-containing protein [Acuticoccus sediminis]
MNDLLASIRRILAEDGPGAEPVVPAGPRAAGATWHARREPMPHSVERSIRSAFADASWSDAAPVREAAEAGAEPVGLSHEDRVATDRTRTALLAAIDGCVAGGPAAPPARAPAGLPAHGGARAGIGIASTFAGLPGREHPQLPSASGPRFATLACGDGPPSDDPANIRRPDSGPPAVDGRAGPAGGAPAEPFADGTDGPVYQSLAPTGSGEADGPPEGAARRRDAVAPPGQSAASGAPVRSGAPAGPVDGRSNAETPSAPPAASTVVDLAAFRPTDKSGQHRQPPADVSAGSPDPIEATSAKTAVPVVALEPDAGRPPLSGADGDADRADGARLPQGTPRSRDTAPGTAPPSRASSPGEVDDWPGYPLPPSPGSGPRDTRARHPVEEARDRDVAESNPPKDGSGGVATPRRAWSEGVAERRRRLREWDDDALLREDEDAGFPAEEREGAFREDDLVGRTTRLAARAAFDELARTVHQGAAGRGTSVEDLAREAMRPLLREWIDANLRTIVERLVREEIERLTGRR